MEATTAQRPDLTEQAALAALVVLVLSELEADELAANASALLPALPPAAVAQAVVLIHPHLLLVTATVGATQAFMAEATDPDRGTASKLMYRTTPARHAAYILNAAKRLAKGGSLSAERRYLSQHLAAERGRRAAALRVDVAAAEHGPILGWRSQLDEATTPGCRRAHGKNFEYDRPPIVEGTPAYPGAIHGGSCRCRAVAPFPGAAVMSPLAEVV